MKLGDRMTLSDAASSTLAICRVIQGSGDDLGEQLAHEKASNPTAAREAGQRDSRKQKQTSGPPLEPNFSLLP